MQCLLDYIGIQTRESDESEIKDCNVCNAVYEKWREWNLEADLPIKPSRPFLTARHSYCDPPKPLSNSLDPLRRPHSRGRKQWGPNRSLQRRSNSASISPIQNQRVDREPGGKLSNGRTGGRRWSPISLDVVLGVEPICCVSLNGCDTIRATSRTDRTVCTSEQPPRGCSDMRCTSVAVASDMSRSSECADCADGESVVCALVGEHPPNAPVWLYRAFTCGWLGALWGNDLSHIMTR